MIPNNSIKCQMQEIASIFTSIYYLVSRNKQSPPLKNMRKAKGFPPLALFTSMKQLICKNETFVG
jgi:hypothetical protein